jgi:ribosome recycling factor
MEAALSNFRSQANKAVEHLQNEYGKLQTGVASAGLVDSVLVEAYGSTQPLKNLANVSVPEPRTIRVQAWDRALTKALEDAIRKADIGLSPVNNGEAIILNIPALTEERRRDIVKVVKKLAEEAKVVIRQARQDALNSFKKLKADNQITEDDQRSAEKRLQDAVDKFNEEVEKVAVEKEKVVMTV